MIEAGTQKLWLLCAVMVAAVALIATAAAVFFWWKFGLRILIWIGKVSLQSNCRCSHTLDEHDEDGPCGYTEIGGPDGNDLIGRCPCPRFTT